MANITFKGKEVQNPVLRVLIATIAIVFGMLGIILAIVIYISHYSP